MQSVRYILLGALAGSALALAALAGLYLSPLRQEIYFASDPALADARARLDTYQDWLSQADARIALKGPDADSLRAEQARVWRDYKAWRSRLGELARVHAQPSGPGFARWAYSSRRWDAPAAAGIILVGALFGFLGARGRPRAPAHRAGKAPRAKPAVPDAQARALSDFEDAVKKIARISRPEAPPQPPPAGPLAEPPPTDRLPIADPGEFRPRPAEPDTKPVPIIPPPGPTPAEDGRETRILQVGEGWGEEPGGPRPPQPGLSMEDEDMPGNGDVTPGAMPPTTEVERVERRKAEVLKLARKGMTSSEISRRLRISQDQVEMIIRMRREKG
jgi:hypothetical protein